MEDTHKLSPEAVFTFLIAGMAKLTLLNTDTGKRFTFKITAPGDTAEDRRKAPIRWVSVLTGTDNDRDYTYLGTLVLTDDGARFVETAKSPKNGGFSHPLVSFVWLVKQAHRRADGSVGLAHFPTVEVRHHNHCGACGRTLTVPESIDTGLGPICAKALGVKWSTKQAA